MRIKSIELKNFRPYRQGHDDSDFVNIEFPEEGQKNIYVVEGRNGAGKTSLHEAIQWCLYGEYMGGGRTQYKRINRNALEEGEEEMFVRIRFDHDGDDFNVIRRAEKVGNSERAKQSLEILKNGEPPKVNKNERQNIIDNILPDNVSEFFFFDGEEMESLAKKMNGVEEEEQVKEQIELLIGLKAVQHGVDDLKDTRSVVEDDLDDERQKETEEEELNEKLEDKKDKKQELDSQITEFEDQIEKLEDQKEEVEKRLEKIESDRLERLKTLETEIENLEDNRIPELQEKYKNLIEIGHVFMLYSDIESAIEAFEKEKEEISNKLDHLNISDAKKEMVATSLHEDNCELCHRDLDKEAESNLREIKEEFEVDEEERARLEKKKTSLDTRIDSLKDAMRKTQGDDPAELKNKIEKLKDQKEEKEKEYEELQEEVTSSKDEESRLQKERQQLQDELENKRAKKQSRKEDLEDIDDEIDDLREKIDSLSDSSMSSELAKQKNLIDKCIEDLNNIRDELAGRKRISILEEANNIFEILTSDNRGYDSFEFIDEDSYGFQIVNNDGSRPDMEYISKGEKQVVALSFIIGLNRFADRTAPIIMDTPVARLDGEYRGNLAALLSNLNEQIILLATDASLTMGFEDILSEDIAAKYEIDEDVDNHTSDIEVIE